MITTDVFVSKRDIESLFSIEIARSMWTMVQSSDVYWETKLEFTKTKQGTRRDYNRAFHVGEMIDFLEEQSNKRYRSREPIWKLNLNEIKARLEGELEL